MGAVEAWISGDHVFNQADSPWFGHDLESGVDLTLVSSDWFALHSGAIETFQFRVNPTDAWMLWGRGLLSNLSLSTDFRLPWPDERWPLILGLAFRHDCKHDIETFYGRTAVHDTLGLSAFQSLPDWDIGRGLAMSADLRLGAEIFLGQVFQSLSAEPYQAKLCGELRWIPLSYQGWILLFVEGRMAGLMSGPGSAVQLAPGWQLDAHANLGLEVLAGLGRVRLWWYADQTGDPWIDNQPVSAFTQGLGLAFIFSAPAPGG